MTHVQRQLALLLSSATGAATAGSDLGRRVFSTLELAALTQALQRLYAPFWSKAAPPTPEATPLMEDLCYELQQAGGTVEAGAVARAGHALADELDQLFVQSAFGATFNAPTNLDLHFGRRAICFDLSHVDETYRPWFYAQILAVLARHIRNPQRGYPVVLAVDELRYLAKDPLLTQLLWDLNKTARTFHAGIWTVDQNPTTYTANDAMRQILANSTFTLIGRQQTEDVRVDRELFPKLTDAHVTQITTAQTGEFVAIFDNDHHFLQIEPSPLELAFFAGT